YNAARTQGRAFAANNTCRWSHFAYTISWRTPSSVCTCLISDRHSRSRAPSNGLGRFFAVQFSAGCTTNMSGLEFRPAQHQNTSTGHTSDQAACSPPLLESLDVGVGEQQRVAGDLRRDRLVEHEAEDVFHLGPAAPFDVAQHRGRILGVLLGKCLLPGFHEGRARRVTVGSGYCRTTAELIEKKIAAIGSTDNLADIRPHQASHGGRGREVNQLFPHPLNHVVDSEDFYTLRTFEQRRQRPYALGHFP